MTNGKIKTAVITGVHPHDVVGFQSMLRSLPEIEAYPQNMWDFITEPGARSRDLRGTTVLQLCTNVRLLKKMANSRPP